MFRSEIVQAFVDASDDGLPQLVAEHLAAMDPAFFEALEDRVSPDRLVAISRLHLRASGRPDSEAQLQCILRLFDAIGGGRLPAALEAEGDAVDEGTLDHVLSAWESTLASRNGRPAATMLRQIALKMIERPGLARLRAQVLLQESSHALQLGELSDAAQAIDEGLLAVHPGDDLVRDALLVNRGIVLWRRGDLPEAARFHEHALSSIVDPTLRARAVSHRAAIHGEMGRWTQAVAALDAAIASWDPASDPVPLAHLHGNRANLWGRLGLWASELEDLERSLALAEADRPSGGRRDWTTVLTCCANLAKWHMGMGDLASASGWLDRLDRTVASAGTESDAYTARRLRVGLLMRRDALDEAAAIASPLPPLVQGAFDPELLALYGSAAGLAVRRGDLDGAEAIAATVLASATENSHEELRFGAASTLGEVELRRGHGDAALGWFDLSDEADRCLRTGTDASIHQVTIGATGGRARHRGLAVEAALLAGDPHRVLREVQRAKTAGMRAHLLLPDDTESIRSALPPGGVLLEYFHTPDISLCVVVRADSPEPHIVHLDVRAADVAAMADLLRHRVRTAHCFVDSDPFEALYGETTGLLDPVASYANQATLVAIGASGRGTDLPWGLLKWADGRHLLETAPVTVVPSGAMLARAERRTSRPCSARLIASPRPPGFGEPRPAADAFHREVDVVRDMLRDLVEPARVGDPPFAADLVHIAAHGHFDPGSPTQSGLDLRDAGLGHLTLLDLQEFVVESQLVCLTGCETGRLHAVTEHDTLGVASLLLVRGARSVLATQWPVVAEDPHLPSRMSRFYGAWLRDGLGRAEALRRAVLPEIGAASPYDWGAFTLFGAASCGRGHPRGEPDPV